MRDRKAVGVWVVRLAPGAQPSAHCLALLSQSEIERADRYRDLVDRTRFAVGRGLLRTVVAEVACVPPSLVRLEQHRHGAVELVGLSELQDLAFSVSHGGRYVLVARAWRPVGVDVEPVPSVAPDALLLRRALDATNAASLLALPGPARARAFAIAWARKEAQFKLTARSQPPEGRPEGRDVEIDLDDEHVGIVTATGRWHLTMRPTPALALVESQDGPAGLPRRSQG